VVVLGEQFDDEEWWWCQVHLWQCHSIFSSYAVATPTAGAGIAKLWWCKIWSPNHVSTLHNPLYTHASVKSKVPTISCEHPLYIWAFKIRDLEI